MAGSVLEQHGLLLVVQRIALPVVNSPMSFSDSTLLLGYETPRNMRLSWITTFTVDTVSSLEFTKTDLGEGCATALHVNVVLSSGYNGDRVRLLVNILPDSANGEMVTRLVVFDKGVSDLNQVTSIITSVSTSSLSSVIMAVQVSVTEVVPAYSVPLGWTETVTLGVGTVHNGMNNQDWIQNYVLVFILLAYSEESDHECCSF